MLPARAPDCFRSGATSEAPAEVSGSIHCQGQQTAPGIFMTAGTGHGMLCSAEVS